MWPSYYNHCTLFEGGHAAMISHGVWSLNITFEGRLGPTAIPLTNRATSRDRAFYAGQALIVGRFLPWKRSGRWYEPKDDDTKHVNASENRHARLRDTRNKSGEVWQYLSNTCCIHAIDFAPNSTDSTLIWSLLFLAIYNLCTYIEFIYIYITVSIYGNG